VVRQINFSSDSGSQAFKLQRRSAELLLGEDGTPPTPIVVDASRLGRDPAYKQWYTENRGYILEHNKRALGAAADINRQLSLRGGVSVSASPSAATPGGGLTPSGRLTRSRSSLRMDATPPATHTGGMSPYMSPLPPSALEGVPTGSPTLQGEPQTETTLVPAKTAGASSNSFQIDQERLISDPDYRAWYEENRSRLESPSLLPGGAPAALSVVTQSVISTLRLSSSSESKQSRRSLTTHRPPPITTAAPTPLSVSGLESAPSTFEPDAERLATDPAYRAWYERNKVQLHSADNNRSTHMSVECNTSAGTGIAPAHSDDPVFSMSNPLSLPHSSSKSGAASAAAAGSSAFEVDRERLKLDPAYKQWYESHKHRFMGAYRSAGALGAVGSRPGRRAGRSAAGDSSAPSTHSSLSPIAAASVAVLTQRLHRSNFVVDEARLHEDSAYRDWYEAHKHKL
jgi:hypothetical protein